MIETRSVVRLSVLVSAFLISFSLPARAQQGVGAIGGTVADTSGAVLPGATITLISPGMIGNGQTTVSDGQGNYEFTRLVPGKYSVRAELQGFQTVIQENLEVFAARTARADLKLSVGALQESVTVTGLAPLLDTTSTLRQTELTREVLESVPAGRDVWSITHLVPAIQSTNYDVGGRAMAEQGTASAHGSLTKEMGYLVDGMDLTAPQEGSLNNNWDTNTAQEVNVQVGQLMAETAKAGVQMNLVTKTGSNKFSGSAVYDGANSGMESNNATDPTLRAQLLAAVPAKALAANPNIVPGSALQILYDSGFELGGPIKQDHIWFMGAFRQGRINRYLVGSYNSDGTQLLDDNLQQTFFGKISAAITKDSQFHGWVGWWRKGRYHQNGSTQTQFAETRTTTYQDGRLWIEQPRFTAIVNQRTVLDFALGIQHQQANKSPQAEVHDGDISRLDSITNTVTVAAPTYNLTCCDNKAQWQVSITRVAGQHDLKVGYQYVRNNRSTFFYSTSNMQATYASGVPTQVKTYNTPTGSVFVNTNNAIYIQDKWRVTRKLTANLGLRWEHEHERVNDGTSSLCQNGTAFIAAQCFAPVDGVPSWSYAAPRLSAIYDVRGDGRTALKFTANRYKISGVGLTGLVNPIKLANDTRPWTACKTGQTSGCDLNGDLIPQLEELGTSGGFNIGTSNTIDPNLKVPYTNELAAEIEQNLKGDIVFSAGYHYRARRRLIGFANQAVPTSGYTPLTVTEATSGQTVTVFNQDPLTKGLNQSYYTNYPQFDDSYHGVDFIFQKRMSHHWMLMASATFAKTDGDIYTSLSTGQVTGFATSIATKLDGDLNNPNNAFRRGPSSFDVPRFFKVDGLYQAPWELQLGVTSQYYMGAPTLTTALVDSQTAKLTQTSQSVISEPFGATRLDPISTTDISISRAIRRGNVRINPKLSIFNIFNQATVTSETTQLGPAYGRALILLGSRLVRAGATVSW